MKGIFKNSEPTVFTAWKDKANEDWTPTFNKLQNPEKAAVRRSLLKEQGFICAYCCSEIKDDVKTTVIEHFIPQSDVEKGTENAYYIQKVDDKFQPFCQTVLYFLKSYF